jgi:hypothetical protein
MAFEELEPQITQSPRTVDPVRVGVNATTVPRLSIVLRPEAMKELDPQQIGKFRIALGTLEDKQTLTIMP